MPETEPQPVQIYMPPPNLPPPKPLAFDDNLATSWKTWKQAWTRYEIATGVSKQENLVRVSTLLSVIGEDGVKAYDTFTWEEDENKDNIDHVIHKFNVYCEPRTQVIYERYRFNNRNQEPGESASTYLTELRTIARNCEHESITPDQILRDRLVLGIRDDKVRERLLRSSELTLKKTVEIIKAAEQTQQQVKHMAAAESKVNIVQRNRSRVENRTTTTWKPQEPRSKNEAPSGQAQGPHTECANCGYTHGRRDCPAVGRKCRKCGKANHFERKCRSKKVSMVHESSDSEDESYLISSLTEKNNAQARVAMTTLQVHKPQQDKSVRFQIDTGSQCDILPAKIYKRVTGDSQLEHLKLCKKEIVSYTGERRRVTGKVSLSVWHQGQKSVLTFNVLDGDYKPLLSLDTSIALGIVSLSNCDVLSLGIKPSDNPVEEYEDVFGGLGELPGTYKIEIDDTTRPVVHAPRRIPVALRPRIKEKLDELVDRKVIVPVTEPTQWVSSMLAVIKPNKIRICIDPRDLNRAIRREHYQLPTVDEVTTRLAGAKKFTICDAKDGFHQIKLDKASSYLTTFNTPFGRYRWCRMPFGISSAPEVWQRRMHEFVEGLSGVEVIADDFLIAGFGETEEDVDASLERNERAFFQKCREWNLRLNKSKLRRAQTTVSFMGHLLTPNGLQPDPSKIQAISEMPPPTDVKGLKRFLGMVNYLSKFLPLLSDMTEPLRRLEDKDTEWCWLEQHQMAFNTVKQYLAKAPVLKYYDVTEEVTIQCDASETGLGAVLLQNEQPVAYASRALTDTETRYAQIEKELLAIVWATSKFDQYILGREVVHVESDHQPLKSVFSKPIHKSPKRLQRMLMALQSYSLDIQYKKGALMWISDALSRAYRMTTESAQHDTSVVRAIEEVDHTKGLSIAPPKLTQFQEETAADPTMQNLIKAIKNGWGTCKKQCPPDLTPYYNNRSELVEDKGLVFLGERLVVPRTLRKEMLGQLHRSHIGIEGCLRRAREVLYWPRMNSEVKDYVSKCSVCQTYKPEQCREALQPFPVPPRPWSMTGADLFELGRQQFIIIVDYWSGFFEVQELTRISSKSVIQACKVQFARHGIPDTLISDNGPQFASAEFAHFVKEWQFAHRTSSPHYPQSNGRAENAVKTCKTLLKKAKADGEDPLLALLDWRNTPTEGMGTSPAQRLMGRRTRTLLPTHQNLLKPGTDPDTAKKLADRKAQQTCRYNLKSHPLVPLRRTQTIRMKLPGEQKWSLGTCTRVLDNRSYEVEVAGRRYRRNRRQLRVSVEPPPPLARHVEDLPQPTPNETQTTPSGTTTLAPHSGDMDKDKDPPIVDTAKPVLKPVEAVPRRSERSRRPPEWHKDYQMTDS